MNGKKNISGYINFTVKDFDPDRITSYSGIKPTLIRKKGQNLTQNERRLPSRITSWELSSYDLYEKDSIFDDWNYIESIIGNNTGKLREITNGLNKKIEIIISSKNYKDGIDIPKSLIEFSVYMNSSIDIFLYSHL